MNNTGNSAAEFFNNKYEFNTVPNWKAGILYILCPFLIFWRVYRWWQKVAVDYNYKVSPFCRAFFFMLIFNYPLFKIIEKHATSHGVKFIIGSKWLASIWIIVFIIPFAGGHGFGNLFLDLIDSAIFAFPFIYIQSKINEVNQKFFPDAFVEKWDVWDTIFAAFSIVSKIIEVILDRK